MIIKLDIPVTDRENLKKLIANNLAETMVLEIPDFGIEIQEVQGKTDRANAEICVLTKPGYDSVIKKLTELSLISPEIQQKITVIMNEMINN